MNMVGPVSDVSENSRKCHLLYTNIYVLDAITFISNDGITYMIIDLYALVYRS